MLEVYTIGLCPTLMYAYKGVCLITYMWNYTSCSQKRTRMFGLSHFKSLFVHVKYTVPPTWRRDCVLSSVMSLQLICVLHLIIHGYTDTYSTSQIVFKFHRAYRKTQKIVAIYLKICTFEFISLSHLRCGSRTLNSGRKRPSHCVGRGRRRNPGIVS